MGLSRSQVQKLPGGELLGLCKRLEIHRSFEALDHDRARSLVLPKLLARWEGDSQDLDPVRLEQGPGLLSGLRHPFGLGEVDDVTGLRVGKSYSFEGGRRPRGRQAGPGRAAVELHDASGRPPDPGRFRPAERGWLPIGGALGYGFSMVRIAVDAMGGDHAPAAVVQGGCEATRTTGATLELVGDPDRIEKELNRWPHDRDRLVVIPAEGFIPMDAKPREALAAAPRASLPVAAARVGADGGPDALVSAGNTGAAVPSRRSTGGGPKRRGRRPASSLRWARDGLRGGRWLPGCAWPPATRRRGISTTATARRLRRRPSGRLVLGPSLAQALRLRALSLRRAHARTPASRGFYAMDRCGVSLDFVKPAVLEVRRRSPRRSSRCSMRIACTD